MTEETLRRLKEIDKELEAIDKEEKEKEEIDMDFNEKMTEFLNDIKDIDFKIFDRYVEITNTTKGDINDLFVQLTHEGIIFVIEKLVRVYCYKGLHGGVGITTKEMQNLAKMGLAMCAIQPDNEFMIELIYKLCHVSEGGDR